MKILITKTDGSLESPILITPTSVSVDKKGNLIIHEAGGIQTIISRPRRGADDYHGASDEVALQNIINQLYNEDAVAIHGTVLVRG